MMSASSQQFDPLLKDLSEKKQNFRRSVVSLARELKDARSRLASQEESVARESLIRQAAENRARSMEEEICHLQRDLDEANVKLQAYASTAEKYLRELDDLRSQLSTVQAAVEVNAASAHSAQIQCLALVNQLDEKNIPLKEHENRVNMLEMQLSCLEKDIQMREASQKQLKDEILRVQQEIMQASVKARVNKDCELKKIEDEISPKSFEKINKHLSAKDEEIAKLREEITTMSTIWKLKTRELETQLEKQRRIDQELKKRVLKLEFYLQEARFQIRKIQRIGEKREQALRELRNRLILMKKQGRAGGTDKQKFWESSSFKIIVSMSMLILIVFAKR